MQIKEINQLKNEIENILNDNKAIEVKSINLKNKTSIADFMIVASGNSSRHIQALSEILLDQLEKKGINTTNWSFFPNGIDDEFLNFPSPIKKLSKSVKTILYAGNIGSGQGLELVIPSIAKHLGPSYCFVIIGDGGTFSLLKKAIQLENISNVELLLPVSRSELIKYYMAADIMFLHLNDVPAFRRVLPSKIFEYTALGKPIVAGLSGYSSNFIKEHLPYACVFESGDAEGAYLSILKASNITVPMGVVDQFIQNYSRESIMDKMAEHLLNVIKCKNQ